MTRNNRIPRAGSVLLLSLICGSIHAGKLDGPGLQNNIKYMVDEEGVDRIDEFGFVLHPTNYEEIYDVYYTYSESPSAPMFITADLPLHTLHLLVDYSVRIIEAEELLPRLERLTSGMLSRAYADYESAPESLKPAARAQFIYFMVASKLLGHEEKFAISNEDSKLISDEISKIEAHQGFEQICFLPPVVLEDYSQYIPRGHYTRSDDFKKYFKTMMWFGRLPLHVPKEDQSVIPMQAALMLSLNLESDPGLAELWQEIYHPTSFFFGKAEDLTPELIVAEARSFYGSRLKPDMFADVERLREFADILKGKHKPRILSELVISDGKNQVKVPLSLRFMPQRFIPDSYIFSQLVFDKVTSYQAQTSRVPFTWGMTDYGPMRVFPRGLDVMAVLGWDNAEAILRKDMDMEYEGYQQQYQKMVDWYEGLSIEELESSIYFRWFELFRVYNNGTAPPLVDEAAWKRKKLMTALGSWTELRHDAILYAKQSYTVGTECAPPPPLQLAVIEEAPELYRKISECSRTIADFSSDTEDHCVKSTFIEFAEILDRMAVLAEKQGEGKSLTADEHNWLWNLSGTLGYLPYKLGEVITNEEDNRMSLIADVHTDVNSGKVLEEATGNPAGLYILVKINGKHYVAQGAVFTYYEFKQSMSDRLTDGAWQEMLKDGLAPAKPAWTELMF